jgi:23S rRNA (cytosine1962-C5)-methyltransferase
LGPLIAACRELTKPRPDFMLLTCHTPGVGPGEAAALLAAALESGERRRIDAGRLSLKATSGAKLDSGVMARWSAR